MKLSDKRCQNAKPTQRPYKLSDGKGLYLQIMPNGSKYWRQKFRFLGKEKLLSHGIYPEVTLKEARSRRDQARKLLREGKDPTLEKKKRRLEVKEKMETTFESVAREWHEMKKVSWTEKYAGTIINRMEADIFPYIGSIPISYINKPMLINMFQSIQSRGVYETARRISQYTGQVFRYAIATGRAKEDPTRDLKAILATKKVEHYPAIETHKIPELLRDIENNKARMYPVTKLAVKFMFLTFVRTSELIKATWDEFDIQNKMWYIPAERMKMKKSHLVPLSDQTISLLEELRKFNGHRQWVFASYVKPKKHLSNNTILAAIYRMGYKGEMCGHGFRALALTALQEACGYPLEVADTQLAHAKRGPHGAAYDRAKFLEQRKVMMQDWADYLDRVTLTNQNVEKVEFQKAA